MAKNAKAEDRLSDLGKIFTRDELTKAFGWSPETASVYLFRWRKADLIEGLGGRSEVFLNLHKIGLRDDAEKLKVRQHAIHMAMPEAVLAGPHAVARAGGLSKEYEQSIADAPLLLVRPKDGRGYSIEGVEMQTRSKAWFESVATDSNKRFRLPTLTAGAALGDMLCRDDLDSILPEDLSAENLYADPHFTKDLLDTVALRHGDKELPSSDLPVNKLYRALYEQYGMPALETEAIQLMQM